MKQFYETLVKVVYSQIHLSWHGEIQTVSPLLAWYPGEVGKMQLWNCEFVYSSFALLKGFFLAGQL